MNNNGYEEGILSTKKRESFCTCTENQKTRKSSGRPGIRQGVCVGGDKMTSDSQGLGPEKVMHSFYCRLHPLWTIVRHWFNVTHLTTATLQ